MLLLVVLSLNCVTTGVHGAWTALGGATPFVGQPRTADQGPPVQKPPSLACARARAKGLPAHLSFLLESVFACT